ncbi:MAG: hypothetical protein OEX81_04540 [Candidatus Pacebacteria bacterium]|nr:hypothetical protein [Candidatus Paceibacterota bacterium]
MFFEQLNSLKETLSLKKEKPDPILWSSASYFSNLNNLDNDTIHQSLTWDIVTFLHEYVGLKDKKIYPYGQRGIMDAYPVKTSEICHNHEGDLKKKNLEITRAQLETKAALTVEAWMEDKKREIGEKLIIISPRGKESEGYPGLDPENYVFVNVYVKVGEDDFQLVQYTSYAREKELQNLQAQFIKNLFGVSYSPPIELQEGEEIKINSLSHQIIDRAITLPIDTNFEQIEDFIYQDEHDKKKGWVTTREDLPKVDERQFEDQLQVVLHTLLEQFWILSEQSPNIAILHFDRLITIVREHFLKWVEEHATNYQQDKNFAPYALNIEEILERWQLSIKKQQEKLTKEEEDKLKLIKKTVELNPLQPLLRASSVAHCIVGTPGSLAMQAMNLNPTMLSLTSSEFISLSIKDKRGLLEKIKSEQMIEIILIDETNGEKQTWMVPTNFLEGKGCFIDEEGIAMGPCDVPLEDSFAFKMTQIEFDQFVYELEQHLLETEIDETQEDLIEKVGAGTQQSDQIKEKIKQIKKIVFKPIVSLTELISGDFISSSIGKSDTIKKIVKQLKNSNNPLETCELILKKLLSEQNGVLSLGNV